MQRRKQLNDDDDHILRDGDSYHVPMIAMDALQRSVAYRITDAFGRPAGSAPGYVFNDDMSARRRAEDAYRKYDERITNAWRDHTSKPVTPVADASQDPYAAYEARLTNAWRTP